MRKGIVLFVILLTPLLGLAQGIEDFTIALKPDAQKASPQVRMIAAVIDLQEPPFYMMNFHEVSEIQEDQRAPYFNQVVKLSKKMKALDSNKATEAVTKDQLKAAMNSEMEWSDLMTKIYRACQDVRNEKSCEKLMDARVAAFELKGRQSEDDRKSNGANHSTSQPTTRPPSK